MDAEDFRHRRAKRGKGAERKAAIAELRMAHTLKGHAMIRHVPGDPKGERVKAEAQAAIDKYSALLLEITYPST